MCFFVVCLFIGVDLCSFRFLYKMEIPSDLSDEIKGKVQEKLENNGVLSNIKNKLIHGLKIAKEEIQSKSKNETLESLKINKFASKNQIEQDSLNRIFKYLSQHGYTWTLSVLQSETGIKPDETNIKKQLEKNSNADVAIITKEEFNDNEFIISISEL